MCFERTQPADYSINLNEMNNDGSNAENLNDFLQETVIQIPLE